MLKPCLLDLKIRLEVANKVLRRDNYRNLIDDDLLVKIEETLKSLNEQIKVLLSEGIIKWDLPK